MYIYIYICTHAVYVLFCCLSMFVFLSCVMCVVLVLKRRNDKHVNLDITKHTMFCKLSVSYLSVETATTTSRKLSELSR